MKISFPYRLAIMLSIGLALCSCVLIQKTTPGGATLVLAEVDGESDFAVGGIGVLTEATSDSALPYGIELDGGRLEVPCYRPARRVDQWQTENPLVIEELEDRRSKIAATLADWVKKELLPEDSTVDVAANWAIEFSEVQIAHTSLNKVRLTADQQCVEHAGPATLATYETVTTLFGTSKITVKPAAPLAQKDVKRLRKAAKKHGVRVRSTAFTYERAQDAQGKPLVDNKKRALFLGPEGEHLRKRKIPAPKKRPAASLTLAFKSPLFFAYGSLPGDVWAREMAPDRCSINLVFDDPVPRIPDCDELSEAGFGVSQSEVDGSLVVKVVADRVTSTKVVAYEQTEMIPASGRVVVWVRPEPLEEGANLSIDSVVLAPGSGPEDGAKAFTSAKTKPRKKKRKKKRN